MHFPRFWALKTKGEMSCWGWSDAGPEEAADRASHRLQNLAQAVQAGFRPKRYAYGSSPLREEVLKEFKKEEEAEPHSVITRNAYGCLILNTSHLMFVDIDLPESELKPKGFFAGLFGKSKDQTTN